VGAIASLGELLRGYAGAAVCAVAGIACVLAPALATDLAKERVETVHFADPRWPTVRVVRGPSTVAPAAAPAPVFRAAAATTEIVTFGDGSGRRVQVVRGSGLKPVRAYQGRVETVHFGGLGAPSVNIVRGRPSSDDGIALFDPANGGELDRVAFAVDGAESGHGSTPLMWRPDLDGPQGPMQVSAAAALDVGGGDRFDMRQNRLLGRAFLARMYQRYGDWPDAIAAYNWGPAHVDQWIAAGRPADKLPLETARYLLKVLRDALLIGAS
jgi:Transglycosylase SLT domain